MSDISLLDGTLLLNGVEIVGWGDSENALEFPNVDIAAVRRGADGRMVSGKTGNFGGPVNITLLQNSPSFAFLMSIVQAEKLGGSLAFQGVFRHSSGFTLTLINGAITNTPSGPTLGNGAPPAATFTIEFERIDSDYTTSI